MVFLAAIADAAGPACSNERTTSGCPSGEFPLEPAGLILALKSDLERYGTGIAFN